MGLSDLRPRRCERRGDGARFHPCCGGSPWPQMRSSPHAEGWNFRAAGGATLPDYVGDLASRTADLAACEAELPPAPPLRTGQTTSYGAGSDGDPKKGLAQGYVDNGDGTITDTRTGLMWETKSDDDAIRDKDNFYRWSGLSFGNRKCWMERS